ncbi:MAG: 16S rRNA (cytosine(1402)-N(4))-methyltransferase RsmH [Parcubacteria group bacterium]|nr:16S rRNA (cytosine(1402)-N(4))-methyltransferase RsmH [Parcubacteria group bacterium]
MHAPVLLNEVVKMLDPQPGEFFIDGTVDGGGHAVAILEKIFPDGKFLGIDLDKNMITKSRKRLEKFKNVILINDNYARLPEILAESNLGKADGLLLDLGFSSEQLENSGRGFSFLKNEPLLMTYDDSEKSVKQILRGLREKELAYVIKTFGEEKFANRIAHAIKEALRKKPIETSGELAEIVRRATPSRYERGRIHPATRTFQALRIYANRELENLEKILDNLREILGYGGRIAVISFHSLEDRIVKNKFKELEKKNMLRILTKKPIAPGRDEVKANPRSRTAKLRAASMF